MAILTVEGVVEHETDDTDCDTTEQNCDNEEVDKDHDEKCNVMPVVNTDAKDDSGDYENDKDENVPNWLFSTDPEVR